LRIPVSHPLPTNPLPKFAAAPPEIVVRDNFLADPDAVRAFALTLQYRHDNSYFRGQRSTTRYLWPGLKEEFERLLGKPITKWEEHTANGVFQFCVAGEQLVYHSDQQQWAAVLYLHPNPPVEAGTTLYRSKELKLRKPEHAKGMPPELASRRMYQGKLLDRTAWEVVDVIGNVYNRCVLWDARLVHAPSEYFGHDLQTGRLFQIFFFDA
jgi:hypothetical protein